MTDHELLISTLREAGRIIGEYIEPGTRDARTSAIPIDCRSGESGFSSRR
jgi:hypothetical protein